MINYFKVFALLFCAFDSVFGLRLRVPSIFGRRVTNIDESLRSAFENSSVVPDVIDGFPLIQVKVSLVVIRQMFLPSMSRSFQRLCTRVGPKCVSGTS